jgi:hypothetical protein
MALLLDKDTTVPPAGAGWLNVTVHVVAIPEFRLVGLHASDIKTADAVRLMVTVFETALSVAVRVALWLDGIVPALAVKFTEVAPDGTVTEAPGTGNKLLLLDNDTAVPPVGDAPLSVTVQVVLFPVLRLVGVHDSELKVSPLPPATVPPVADVVIA